MRKNFAYNFPGLLKLTDKKSFDKLKPYYLNMITKEQSIQIRQILVASLHEVAIILGNDDAYKELKDIFKKLLTETNTLICDKLIDNLDKILESIKPT